MAGVAHGYMPADGGRRREGEAGTAELRRELTEDKEPRLRPRLSAMVVMPCAEQRWQQATVHKVRLSRG